MTISPLHPLQALAEKARAATAGPWKIDQNTVVISGAPWPMDYGPHWQDWTDKAGEPLGRFVAETATNEPEGAYNADFIAAANPSVILALVEEVEGLRSTVEQLNYAVENLLSPTEVNDLVRTQRERIEALEAAALDHGSRGT